MMPRGARTGGGYLTELRTNWRPLCAATFGYGTSSSSYGLLSMSVMAPLLLADLGWSKAAFAMLGTLSLVGALCVPIAGRLADTFGVRRTAFIGITVLPIGFVGLAFMTGPIWQYAALHLAQGVLCVTTTATVYGRLAVQHTDKARGLALAIVISGGAVAGIVGAPLLNGFTEAHGWRAGYLALAACSAATGLITLLLLPKDVASGGQAATKKRRARDDYPAIFRTPAFWVLFSAMLLCHLPFVVAVSQLKIILLENGVTPKGASVMLSAFAGGMLVGRVIAGLALDRFPAHLVGMIGMSLPAIGLLIFASSFDGTVILTLASLLIGCAFGADGDIAGYIVSRKFSVAIYSSVMGLITMAITLSIAAGSALLSLSLKLTGDYNTFLVAGAMSVIVGASLFLLLERLPQAAGATALRDA